MSDFWNKVNNCDHKNFYPEYAYYMTCNTEYCTGVEDYHCKDCGAYITKCGCGFHNTISGWPLEKRRNYGKY